MPRSAINSSKSVVVAPVLTLESVSYCSVHRDFNLARRNSAAHRFDEPLLLMERSSNDVVQPPAGRRAARTADCLTSASGPPPPVWNSGRDEWPQRISAFSARPTLQADRPSLTPALTVIA